MNKKPATHPATQAAAPLAVAVCFAAQPLGAQAADAAGRLLLQITPAGDFLPSDGRAMDVPAWRINAQIAGRVIAATAAHRQPPVIDYEHQTLHKEANGQPAPAAGWMHALRWVEGKGLYAEVELTARAKELVAAGEYRYFSPVFEYSRNSGEVVRVLMGALTNNPAIHGMDAVTLQAAATARFAPAALTAQPKTPNQEKPMNLLQTLLAALGLPENTTEAAAIAACTAYKAQADAARAALALGQDATAETVTAACTALSAKANATSAAPDPAKYVPVAVVEELRTSVAALTAAQNQRAVDDLVAPALQDGRLLPAQEAWARDLGASNMAALTSYLQTAKPIAALTGTQTGGQPPAGGAAAEAGLSADELAVAAACGITADQFAKAKQ